MNALRRLSLGFKSKSKDLNDDTKSDADQSDSIIENGDEIVTVSDNVEDNGKSSDVTGKIDENMRPSIEREENVVPFIDGGSSDSDNQTSLDIKISPQLSISSAVSPSNLDVDNANNCTSISISNAGAFMGPKIIATGDKVLTPTTSINSSPFRSYVPAKKDSTLGYSLSTPNTSHPYQSKTITTTTTAADSPRRYSSPFAYASPYSSYAARRTSLRSPSLWSSERVSTTILPSLSSVVTLSTQSPDYRRLAYVTPTFGGNDNNLITQHPSLYPAIENNSKSEKHLRSTITVETRNGNLNDNLLSQSSAISSVSSHYLPDYSTNDCLAAKSSPNIVSHEVLLHNDHLTTATIEKSNHSNIDYNDEVIDSGRILNSYLSSRIPARNAKRTPVYKQSSNSPRYDSIPEGESPPSDSSLYHGSFSLNDTQVEHVDPFNCVGDSAIATRNSVVVSSNLYGGSDLPEQKRMSMIDGRLKVLPDQVSAAKKQLIQHGDGGSEQDKMAAVMHSVINFEGECK